MQQLPHASGSFFVNHPGIQAVSYIVVLFISGPRISMEFENLHLKHNEMTARRFSNNYKQKCFHPIDAIIFILLDYVVDDDLQPPAAAVGITAYFQTHL